MKPNNNSKEALRRAIFKIGTVSSVDGRTVKVEVDRNKNSSHLFYNGELIKNVSVGSYVKIWKGFLPIIGQVDSEYIVKNEIEVSDLRSPEETINRVLNVKLVGFFQGERFKRGILELPLIDNECHLLTDREFKLIHTLGNTEGKTLSIAHLATDSLIPISISIGKLFSSHIGIFGNTGSGKSYTLSKLYRELFVHYSQCDNFINKSKFLFFDYSGEYSSPNAIVPDKLVYKLSTRDDNGDKIPLSEDDLLDLDLLSIFSNATEKTQRPFIDRCIRSFKNINNDDDKFRNFLKDQIKKILTMSDKLKGELLIDYIQQILPKNEDSKGRDKGYHFDFEFNNKYNVYSSNNVFFQSTPEAIEELQIYQKANEFSFMESGNFLEKFIAVMYMQLIYDVLANRALNEHISPAINKLKQAVPSMSKVFDTTKQVKTFWYNDSKEYKNIVVIDLSQVDTLTKKRIPLLLAKKLYNEHKKNQRQDSFLNIIIDEAHNVLSYQSSRESEEWKDYRLEVFEEIIKEGRKFGVFMTIASQRPSDISTTIISQLHNYFIHRLVNEHDIEHVNNTISYLDKLSVESLPILPTGVCIIAGQLLEMPLVVKIDPIEDENRPQNETLNIEKLWESN